MKAGFIGLGHLGRHLAARLIEDGVELLVWNRTPGKADGLGAELAASPAELISRVPAVFLSLADSPAVHAVLTGERGLLAGDCAGRLIVDTSTHHFQHVVRFHELAAERGAAYLEAPAAGSVAAAARAELSLFVSGQREHYEQALPYLEKLGNHLFFLGPPGLATKLKLIDDMVLGSLMATLGEALLLAEKVGLPRGRALEVLSAGAGASALLAEKREKLLAGDFTPQLTAAQMHRSLDLLADLGDEMRHSIFTGRMARELYSVALAKGYDELDLSVIYKTLEEI
jgi:3-hydroxyisobutyrate dehydrogenase